MKQALCCSCGQLRTCKVARNTSRDFSDVAQWKSRWVGELKCSHCAAVTPHALLLPEQNRHWDEREQQLALGAQPRTEMERMLDLERLRGAYRRAFPRNPNLVHRRWDTDAIRAWDDGTRRVIALCGEPIEVKSDPRQAAKYRTTENELDGYLIAREFGDTEYEDPKTGLWWLDMDCVDCVRASNEHRALIRRLDLEEWLAWFARNPDALTQSEADDLYAAFNKVVASLRRRKG
ncbi:MAG: hypothetical protein AB1925_15630 [Actinomycetota bacterium]